MQVVTEKLELPPLTLQNPDGKRLMTVDIGTTTIAMQLYDMTGKVVDILQRNHLTLDFFHRELLAHDALVLGMVRAVRAGVDAVVREVERREEHDAAAVDVLLHLDGGLEDPVVDLLDVAGDKLIVYIRSDDNLFHLMQRFYIH